MTTTSSLFAEALFALADVPPLLPRRQDGQLVHPATIRRWAASGVCGVVLETARIGGSLLTSEQAVARFLARQNESNSAAHVGRQPGCADGGRTGRLTES